MASSEWQAALTRWGDALWRSALLATDDRAVAETTVVAACSRAFAAQPADIQAALYAELAREQRAIAAPWRYRLRRKHVLPRSLHGIAPRDRLLLDLWLLHGMSAERIAAIFDQTPPTIIARGAAVVARISGQPQPVEPTCVAHMQGWIAAQFGEPRPPDRHQCVTCVSVETAWRNTIEHVRREFRAAVERERLPQRVIKAIDAGLDQQQKTTRWWQQQRFMLPTLVALVGVLLVVLIMPAQPLSTTEAGTAPPGAARNLVQTTFERWSEVPPSGTRHWQVRAVPWNEPATDPSITDVWLTGGASAQHVVEVRRGDTLIEVQSGDGVSRLQFRAATGDSACPWELALENRLQAQTQLRLSPEQQRTVRDMRLRQGAFGTGYRALEQALAADDLRAFGTRRDGQTILTVAGYTDQRPGRQILLLIDPALQQLVAVQAIATVGDQTHVRDLWRLLQREDSSTVKATAPATDTTTPFDVLIDPACPALSSANTRSLRTLLDTSREPWYLPAVLPPGITRAAIIAPNLGFRSDDSRDQPVYSAVFIGPDRSLRVSAAYWRPNTSADSDQQRGPWRGSMQQTEPGVWRGTLRRALYATRPAFVPTIDLVARGWSEAELNTLIQSLSAVDIQLWQRLRAAFLDPQPLAPEVEALIVQAIDALALPPDRAVFGAAQITTRPAPEPALADPYAIPASVRFPPQLTRQQWLVSENGAITRFRDSYTLPDGSLHHALLNDGARLTLDNRADGWIGAEAVQDVDSMAPQQPGLSILSALLATSEPIALTGDGTNRAVLTQHSAAPVEERALPAVFGDNLPQPWIGDLPIGQLVRRVLIDQATRQPQELQIAWQLPDSTEIMLQQVVITARRPAQNPPDDLANLPPPPDDILRFNAIAYRWQQARTLQPPLSIHWLMSSLNFDADARSTLETSNLETPVSGIFGWPSEEIARLNWELLPATAIDQINIGTLQFNTWQDLSGVSALHRAQYSLAGGTVTLTVGPASLMRTLLRYPPQGMGWTQSERLPVVMKGSAREAWLLQDMRGSAVLIVEVDNTLVHIAGPADFLRGALLDELPKLVWFEIE